MTDNRSAPKLNCCPKNSNWASSPTNNSRDCSIRGVRRFLQHSARGEVADMSEEASFLDLLRRNPFDVATRLIYADWLADRERFLDAALQRVLAEPEKDEHRMLFAEASERGIDPER